MAKHDFKAFADLESTFSWSVEWYRLVDTVEIVKSQEPALQSITSLDLGSDMFWDGETERCPGSRNVKDVLEEDDEGGEDCSEADGEDTNGEAADSANGDDEHTTADERLAEEDLLHE